MTTARLIKISNLHRWFLGKIHWVDFLLSLSILGIMVYVLENSSWVWHPPALIAFMFVGAFIGILLGRTRWLILFNILYILAFGLAIGMQSIANLIVSNFDSFWIWLEYSNWQIFLFMERFQGWTDVILSGKIIYDQGFWEFLLIFISVVSSAWLMLCLQRKINPILGVIPTLFSMGYGIHQDQKPIFFFLVALFFCLIMLHSQDYQQKEAMWQKVKLDFPEQLWLDKSGLVIYLSVIVLIVASIVSLLITKEGIQDIRDWVKSMTKPQVAEYSPSEDGSVSSGTNADGASSNLLQPIDMSRVGSPIPTVEGIVMRVRVMDPTPRPWRLAIYDQYTGQGWIEAAYDESQLTQTMEFEQAGRKALLQRFTLYRKSDERLFAAAEPVQVIGEGAQIVPLVEGESQILTGVVQGYEVISMVPSVYSSILKKVEGDIPQSIKDSYLQVPEAIPERVNQQVRRLFADNPSYYEKVIRAQEYVRQAVPYDLNAPAPEENRDIVDYFLFEAESGFCTYYASAMAVILRIEGIPSRVVTGYAPGVYVVEEGYFEVTGDLAHAWVEVYFPEYGWIPFEPTPSQAVPSYSLEEEMIEDPVVEEIETFESKVVLLIRQILLAVVVSAVILVSGIIFVRFIKQRNREKHMKLHPVELIYQRMRMNLAKAGFTTTPAMTPREFMEEARQGLDEYPKLRDALVQGTYLFEAAFYGFRQMDAQEIHRLRFRYRDAYWEQIKLRLKFLMGRLKIV